MESEGVGVGGGGAALQKSKGRGVLLLFLIYLGVHVIRNWLRSGATLQLDGWCVVVRQRDSESLPRKACSCLDSLQSALPSSASSKGSSAWAACRAYCPHQLHTDFLLLPHFHIPSFVLNAAFKSIYTTFRTPLPRAMSQPAKTLHFIWWQGWADAANSIPADARQWVKEWEQLHPDFAVQRWDEALFHQVAVPRVEAAFPNVRDVLARLHAAVEKVDVARWLILYAFGGVYVDCDMRCMKGVCELYDECLRNSTIFLAKEPGGCFNNAIICSARPADPAVRSICIGLFQNILFHSRASDWPGPVVVTGPVAITSIISAYQLAPRLKVEGEGPLVFGAGAKGTSVRSANSRSDVLSGASHLL